MKTPITIGLAGHIDHGKTALTKALTNIETDRLKEEKRRKISIENGFAFLDLDDGSRAAVIDVPGHERFIRQMIAGASGMDLVLLVIAADEGVMPQTREHLAILQLLAIPHAMIIVTKSDLVDDEWMAYIKEDIAAALKETDYEKSPIYLVDSLSGRGITELKSAINAFAGKTQVKNATEPLRLPIDHVFSLHGHGTIARGTIFNGKIALEGQGYRLLPQDQPVRIKQLQVHHASVTEAVAGERVAVNLAGTDHQAIKRGDVIVSGDVYKPTTRLDVVFQSLKKLDKPLKQRAPIVLHLATSAVQGRLILFDRNRWEEPGTIYGQIELKEPVVAQKGDRFILRRPTPVETLGGGVVLNPVADQHPFGWETVQKLMALEKGTPEEWIEAALSEEAVLTIDALGRKTGLAPEALAEILLGMSKHGTVCQLDAKTYALTRHVVQAAAVLIERLRKIHRDDPLRSGMNQAEWRHSAELPKLLAEAAIKRLLSEGAVVLSNNVIRLKDFTPHLPERWKKQLTTIADELQNQGLEPDKWALICQNVQIPEQIASDYRRFLVDAGKAFALTDDRLVDASVFRLAVEQLRERTESRFTIPEAKEVLKLTRKNMIPFLELCDRLKLTKRDGEHRLWVKG